VILVKFDAVVKKSVRSYDKYSAVAEMSDRFSKIDTGRKLGGAAVPLIGGTKFPSKTVIPR